MKYSEHIIPISYLKTNASKITEDVFRNGQTYIITQNGYAKLAVIGIKEYERTLKEINSLTANINKISLSKKLNSKKKISRKKRILEKD